MAPYAVHADIGVRKTSNKIIIVKMNLTPVIFIYEPIFHFSIRGENFSTAQAMQIFQSSRKLVKTHIGQIFNGSKVEIPYR